MKTIEDIEKMIRSDPKWIMSDLISEAKIRSLDLTKTLRKTDRFFGGDLTSGVTIGDVLDILDKIEDGFVERLEKIENE